MKGGRKNMKRAAEDKTLTLQPGQSIMKVLSLRGSNLIEVIDEKGGKALALFPAKFQKSMWIKRGNFLVVDESGREEAIGSGRKVSCVVSQVLFHDQVRVLQKSPQCEILNTNAPGDHQWPYLHSSVITTSSDDTKRPDIFKFMALEDSGKSLPDLHDENGAKLGDNDDKDEDGLPPLEANTNRTKPLELQQSDTDSDSDTDT